MSLRIQHFFLKKKKTAKRGQQALNLGPRKQNLSRLNLLIKELDDNCKILGRDTVSGQTYKHIFHQMGAIEFIILQTFYNAWKKTV